MAGNWLGLLSIGLFYMSVLGIGIWASRKSKREERKCTGNRSEVAMVGGRNLNIWVSIFTMSATWVGGGYILGNAEVVYDPTKGLVWALGPPAFAVNMIIGGLFFVKPIRSKNYVTLMDPFQEKYGNTVAAVLFIPALLADIFWIACILGALGGTVSVVLDISSSLAMGISASVAITYTLMGGLYSVAYTDVVQLGLMFFGLWLCVPFVLTSASSANFTVAAVTKLHQEPWVGKLQLEDSGRWVDDFLLIAVGGICYQAFYQRVLSMATDAQAKITCYAAAGICPLLGIPSILIGAAAASTNWNQTSYGSPSPYEEGQAGMILPIALQHLCPFYVSLVGIGALAASVMSSVDSALLSAASQIGRNIFKNIIYKRASEQMIIVVVKVSIVLCGIIASALAMTSRSIHLFWILSADIMYSVMTPQVTCTFFLSQWVNQYGACSGFALGILVRVLVGEPLMGLPDVLPLPWDRIQEDGHRYRLFPFRTVIMLLTIATILLVSRLAACLSKMRLRASDAETDTNLHSMAPIPTEVVEDERSEKEQPLFSEENSEA
ncbi:high-affinity choline transporter 1-like [Hippoglossus hippoglossus]|uniref:high-affinity choline transporter 1-like n=1 Tax=Hippoglossus hippoglossus TaxID=8267 RepID=UPI00148B95F3|nr:high-affinity choline transporter 1-like [Hippoglossus hippoglossus]XP_034434877.1 high-affinity choline transporter 1-like [Hippoglossus hippoglossus]XP_034434879.1 high-affinity choline transporter 1-like [Hippoglossus hippoglossus]